MLGELENQFFQRGYTCRDTNYDDGNFEPQKGQKKRRQDKKKSCCLVCVRVKKRELVKAHITHSQRSESKDRDKPNPEERPNWKSIVAEQQIDQNTKEYKVRRAVQTRTELAGNAPTPREKAIQHITQSQSRVKKKKRIGEQRK